MTYDPKVDDYVRWNRPNGDTEEGWVYFKCPPMEKKKGFTEPSEYITIEVGVKPRPDCEYSRNYKHKKIHTLLLCYKQDWDQLEYIKNRRMEEHFDRLAAMYKAQEGRPLDTQ